jgi:hypothetical protein
LASKPGVTGFHKKRIETIYAELVFLHPVGSASHVVHFGTSGARNIDTLFFMLGWDWYRFHKKTRHDTIHRTCVFASGVICGSRSAFRCVRDMKCRRTIFYAQVGLVRIPQKAHRDRLRRTCVFSLGWGGGLRVT